MKASQKTTAHTVTTLPKPSRGGLRAEGLNILSDYRKTNDGIDLLTKDLRKGVVTDAHRELNKAFGSRVKSNIGATSTITAMVKEDTLNYSLVQAERETPGTVALVVAVGDARVTGNTSVVEKLAAKVA